MVNNDFLELKNVNATTTFKPVKYCNENSAISYKALAETEDNVIVKFIKEEKKKEHYQEIAEKKRNMIYKRGGKK